MKSYTDLGQSLKLAEFLPLESADMGYLWNGTSFCDYPVSSQTIFNRIENIPCWSLGALISLLPKRYCLETLDNGTYACYNFLSQYEKFGKTPIDAVYSMIVFLKEENII